MWFQKISNPPPPPPPTEGFFSFNWPPPPQNFHSNFLELPNAKFSFSHNDTLVTCSSTRIYHLSLMSSNSSEHYAKICLCTSLISLLFWVTWTYVSKMRAFASNAHYLPDTVNYVKHYNAIAVSMHSNYQFFIMFT